MAVPLLIRRQVVGSSRGRFAFPGGRPGFDPQHVAAADTIFSAVPADANMRNLLNGIHGSTPTSLSASNFYPMGPITTAGNFSSTTFTNTYTGAQTLVTIAAIVKFSNVTTGTQSMIGQGTNATTPSAGYALQLNSSSQFVLSVAGVGQLPYTGYTALASVPYFVAISSDSSNTAGRSNIVITRLDTAQMYDGTFTSTIAPTNPNGQVQISASGIVAAFSLAAAMITRAKTNAADLRKWQADPWSFWYPK